MLKTIKYNLIIFFICWSNKALAQFVEINKEKPTEDSTMTGAIDSMAEIITFLFAIIFVLSIIGFLFSGVKFMAAGGDEGTLDSAHKAWVTSLTGLMTSLVGYIIISLLRIIF